MSEYNRNNSSAGMTAAAGQQQLRELIQSDKYSDIVISRVYKDAVASMLTNGKFIDGLAKCGHQIGFRVDQKIEVYDLQENQELAQQIPSWDYRYISINKAKYFNIKIDRVAKAQICDFGEIAKNFCRDASRSLKERLDPEIIMDIARSAARCNRGKNAGPSGRIDFGTFNSPREIAPKTFTQALVEARIALSATPEGSYWEAGDMVVVLPIEAQAVISHTDSPLSGVGAECCGTEVNEITKFNGWKIVYSNNVPYNINDAGDYVYYIVFTSSTVNGFVQQIEECEVKDAQNHFGEFYRGLWTYGNGTLIPEGVAVGRFTFNPDA